MRLFPALFVTVVGTCVPLVACRDTAREQPGDAGAAATTTSAIPSAPATPSGSTAVNVLPIPSASVSAAVNPRGFPVYDGPLGSVEGTITVEGEQSPDVSSGFDFKKCPDGIKTYGKLFREGTALANGARPLADAIVGVTDYAPGFFVPERSPAVKVTIDGCEFRPRTIAMTFGQRIEIINNTKLVIAPALDRTKTAALLIAPPQAHGDPVRLYPPHPGFFTISDQMDLDFLTADVYVLLHPFHATTGFDGHYRIDGVPVGKAKVFSRLRAIGREVAKDVEIVAGQVAKVDLVLHYEKRDAGAAAVDAGPRPKVIP